MPNEADDLGAALAAPVGSAATAMAETRRPADTERVPKTVVIGRMERVGDIAAALAGPFPKVVMTGVFAEAAAALETLAPIAAELADREALAPLAELVDAHREGLAEVAAELAAIDLGFTDDHHQSRNREAFTELAAGLAADTAEAVALASLARQALDLPHAFILSRDCPAYAENPPTGDLFDGFPVVLLELDTACPPQSFYEWLTSARRARTRRTVTTARQLRRSIARRHDIPRPVPASPVAARPRRYCRRTYAGARRSDDPSPTRSAESPTGGFMSGVSASLKRKKEAPTDH